MVDPEPARQGYKRRFTLDQIKHIIQQTRKLINEGKLKPEIMEKNKVPALNNTI